MISLNSFRELPKIAALACIAWRASFSLHFMAVRRNQDNLAVVKRVFNRRAAKAYMGLYEFFKAMRLVIFPYLEIPGFLRKI